MYAFEWVNQCENNQCRTEEEQIEREKLKNYWNRMDEWMYKPSPIRRLIFFKTFILLFMGENELSSLQWHFFSLTQQLFCFLSFLSCFNDFSPLKPIKKSCVYGEYLQLECFSAISAVIAPVRWWCCCSCCFDSIPLYFCFFFYLIICCCSSQHI